MSKVIAIANQKGGVGKSTIAVNLAVCAVKDGLSTLLIDADIQGSSISFRAIRDFDDLKAVSITQPTIHKDIESFSNFDLIIIDVGAKDTTTFRSAIMSAAKGILLIPVLPSQYDIWATEDTFNVLAEARVLTDIKACTVFNQVIQNTKVCKEANQLLNKLISKKDIPLLNTVLFNRVDYKKSISKGLGVIEYDPCGKASIEMNNLYNELKEVLYGN